MALLYSPNRWYWIVGNITGNNVFSGPLGDYVASDDATYQQWLTDGGIATNIPTDGELADVLTMAGMSPMAVRTAGWTDWGNAPVQNQFNAMVMGGCSLVSTATPALNGIYPMQDNDRTRQNSNMNYIAQNGGFAPDNAATKAFPDITGAMHTFPSVADFQNYFTATGDWYSTLADWVAAGGTGPLPTEPVTIP
jgi:hypothetical protein